MTKKVLLLPFLLLFILPISNAQRAYCGQQRAEQHFQNQFPTYQKAVKQTFDEAQNHYRLNATQRSTGVHQVKVVVHVVYNTDVANVSEDLIRDQIQVLNEDFRRTNADAENARDIFKAIGADAEIEFVLADVDPDGNPTSGITRTQTDVKSFVDMNIGLAEMLAAAEECGLDFTCIQEKILVNGLEGSIESGGIQMDDVKRSDKGGVDPWNPEEYINIWVTNLNIDFLGQEMPAILGFAYPPVGAPNWPDEVWAEDLTEIDGLVIHHEAFGRTNANSGLLGSLADGGRTTTHEMGHYFGLRHVHGDGGCGEDDGISDTPAADAEQQAQADPNNLPVCEDLYSIDTCPEDDMPDMVENYMDYNAITCQNLFTQEQVGIMRAMLEGPRAGLISGLTNTESVIATQALTIYPNPTSNTLYLAMEGYQLADFEVQVQSIVGTEVALNIAKGNSEIDMSGLTSGVYLVRLVKDDLQIVKKVSVLTR